MKREYIKKFLPLVAMLAPFPQQLFAQATTEPVVVDSHTDILMWSLFVIIGMAILVTIFTLVRMVMGMAEKMSIDIRKANGTYVEPAIKEDMADIFLRSFSRSISDAVPIEQEASIDLGHNYDGIRELDNNLPPWWKAMFYASIVFAFGYMYYYHMGGGGTSIEEDYNIEMEDARLAKLEYLDKQANNVDETNVMAMTGPQELEAGKAIFINLCAPCHGQNGEGNVGPNLTDEFWIHGGGISNVFKVVKYGVPAKGMISWQAQLSPIKMQQVASYILTLEGTAPANPKEPQGEKYVPETDSATVVLDSTQTAMK